MLPLYLLGFELGRFSLKTGDRDKKESDPGEPAELKKKKKKLEGKKNFCICSHAN